MNVFFLQEFQMHHQYMHQQKILSLQNKDKHKYYIKW